MNKFILLIAIVLFIAGCTSEQHGTTSIPSGGTGNQDSTNNGGYNEPETTQGKLIVKIVGAGRVYSSPTRDIDCPGACSAVLTDEFPFLNARPADGWYFVEWQGDDVGCFTDSCPLTPKDLKHDITMIAVFEQ